MKRSSIIRRILSIALVLVLTASLMGCAELENILADLDLEGLGGGGGIGGEQIGGETTGNNYVEIPDPERNDFIENIGGVSETYEGAVSVDSYDSAKDAAEAYIAEEIAGESEATVLEADSKGELSDSEIKELALPAELSEGITAVEEYEITYEVEDDEESMLADGAINLGNNKGNKTKKVKVYVIKYGKEWKYFSPAPVNGNTITKSYYNSVFNAEKYMNCTLSADMDINIVVSTEQGGQSFSMTQNVKTTQTIKHADGKIFLEQRIVTTESGKSSTNYICAYLEEIDGETVCYVKTSEDGDWYETYLSSIGFTSIEQLAPFHDQYLDYTYFTKTGYGFALEKENAAQYMKEALSGMDAMFGTDDMDIDMFAEYYVCDGVLSGMRVDAEVSMDVSQAGVSMTMDETVISNVTCTDYGTTVIERPFED